MIGGHRSLLVSWYQDTAASPARVSFVNADSLDGGGSTYNSATLVIPAGRTVRPIKTHAGGIAWYKHYLFVAETHVGVRVFDTNYILGAKKLPRTADLDAPFVLPQVGYYRQAKGAGLTFSFVETDRSSPALITGKYADQKYNRRIVRWPLDADRGLPGLQADGAWKMPASNVQGGLMHNGRPARGLELRPEGLRRHRRARRRRAGPARGALGVAGRRRGPALRGHEPPRVLADREGRRPDRVRDRRRLGGPDALESDDVTAIAILLGLAIGVVVGAVGGGGAILALPVLIYVLDEPVGPASTASLVVVSLAAAIGAGSLARHGRVCWRLAFTFAVPAALGSLLGTFASRSVGRERARARVRAGDAGRGGRDVDADRRRRSMAAARNRRWPASSSPASAWAR